MSARIFKTNIIKYGLTKSNFKSKSSFDLERDFENVSDR